MRFLFFAVLLSAFTSLSLAGEEKVALKPEAGARKLYLTKCSKCHKLYDPAKYTDQQWQAWMDKMSHKAKLSSEQKELITNYVADNLRRGSSSTASH